MALSIRLRSRMSSRPSSPASGQMAVPEGGIRVMARLSAASALRSITRRATATRSAGRRSAAARWSSRASVSSCSTRRVARSMPVITCTSALRRAVSSLASMATSACTRRAASGVRSSWAASAVKRRSLVRVVSSRANRRLSATTSGPTSAGTGASIGLRLSGARSRRSRTSRSSGNRLRRTASHISTSSTGSAISHGIIWPSTSRPTSRSRVLRRWPTTT